jgi:hypothetical protein
MEIASDVGLLRLAIGVLRRAAYDATSREPARRADALAFLCTDWAQILADGVNLDPARLREYAERHDRAHG